MLANSFYSVGCKCAHRETEEKRNWKMKRSEINLRERKKTENISVCCYYFIRFDVVFLLNAKELWPQNDTN